MRDFIKLSLSSKLPLFEFQLHHFLLSLQFRQSLPFWFSKLFVHENTFRIISHKVEDKFTLQKTSEWPWPALWGPLPGVYPSEHHTFPLELPLGQRLYLCSHLSTSQGREPHAPDCLCYSACGHWFELSAFFAILQHPVIWRKIMFQKTVLKLYIDTLQSFERRNCFIIDQQKILNELFKYVTAFSMELCIADNC